MDTLGTKAVWVVANDNPDNDVGTRSRFSRLRPDDVEALRRRDLATIRPDGSGLGRP